MTEPSNANMDSMVGRLVVDQGLATADDVHECVEAQRRAAPDEADGPVSLAQVLVSRGIVTRRQLNRLRPQIDAQRGGQQIPGYRIIKRLGAGAMAVVYLAKQLSLDRLVAIKILPRKHTDNTEFVERFYAEGRAAAKLNHPNIVGALDVGKAGDTHYFVMEYVEGRTVFDDITEHQRYKEKEALAVVIQVARALEHAHQAGLIHRDVKPKNIMITPEGVAKLADMGLARAVTDREVAESEQGKAFGTPYYISPEQTRGERDVDFRADIYSLGVTFYHMVTGQVPFDGPNPSAVMQKHLKEEVVPPDHLNPNLSAGVGEIIEVCMAKNRNQRYDSTTALLADLESVARGGAPLLARKKFDVLSLSALGSPAETVDIAAGGGGGGRRRGGKRATPVVMRPLFWAAIVGWATVGVLVQQFFSRGM